MKVHYEPSGYRMIESFEIQNFRCFEQVEVPDCRRVNVVVGKNASGKTALLEAVFLALGSSPEIATRFRGWRGYDPQMSGTFEQIEEAMWGNLFHKFDISQPLAIHLYGTGDHQRSIEVTPRTSELLVPTTPELVDLTHTARQPRFGVSAFEWKWTRADGTTYEVRPQFTGVGYQFQNVNSEPLPATFFASSHPFYNQENVNCFSKLSKRREQGAIVGAISKAFPFIKNLDIQAHAGVSMVHADIPSLPEKIPLTGVSPGVNKLSTLLMAIVEQKNGVVIIDEIENGIHYSLYELFWKTLYEFCRDNDVQIFASTHSSECLDGLVRACRRHAGDISIIRAEMDETGSSRLLQFYGSAVLSGIQHGEVR